MGAQHPHKATQSAIEARVREQAAILEVAPYGFRPNVGFQARRLMEPVDGPEYGDEANRFPAGTLTTPNNASRFTREYERRGGVYSNIGSMEKPEHVSITEKDARTKLTRVDSGNAPAVEVHA